MTFTSGSDNYNSLSPVITTDLTDDPNHLCVDIDISSMGGLDIDEAVIFANGVTATFDNGDTYQCYEMNTRQDGTSFMCLKLETAL